MGRVLKREETAGGRPVEEAAFALRKGLRGELAAAGTPGHGHLAGEAGSRGAAPLRPGLVGVCLFRKPLERSRQGADVIRSSLDAVWAAAKENEIESRETSQEVGAFIGSGPAAVEVEPRGWIKEAFVVNSAVHRDKWVRAAEAVGRGGGPDFCVISWMVVVGSSHINIP